MGEKRTGRTQHWAARVWVPLHPPCSSPSLYLPQHPACQIHLFVSPKLWACFVLGLSPALFCFLPLPHFITPSFITLIHYCTCIHKLCWEVRGQSLHHFSFLSIVTKPCPYFISLRIEITCIPGPYEKWSLCTGYAKWQKLRNFSLAPITSCHCLKSPAFVIFPF